jgi:hypothetical protein
MVERMKPITVPLAIVSRLIFQMMSVKTFRKDQNDCELHRMESYACGYRRTERL